MAQLFSVSAWSRQLASKISTFSASVHICDVIYIGGTDQPGLVCKWSRLKFLGQWGGLVFMHVMHYCFHNSLNSTIIDFGRINALPKKPKRELGFGGFF